MAIQCFLIEPIYGGPLPPSESKYDGWPPRNFIIGWKRKDTGQEYEHNSGFGVGAMWFATWYWRGGTWDNEVEPHLLVRCPNGAIDASGRFESTSDWDIDSRCSNCSLPDDKLHRCWVRHGEVPNITVDKAGVTCSAGAGSIALPKWHGFLRNGELVQA